MPIIDLNTGEYTDEAPKRPTNKEPVAPIIQSSGIIDLDTGLMVADDKGVDKNQQRDALLQAQADSIGPVESAMISAGKTISDVGRLITGGEESEAEKKALAMLRENRPISTAIGQAVPFVIPGIGVANIASLPTRVIAATGLGGAEGATIASGTGKNVFDGAGLGALIGGGIEIAFPILGRLGGKLFRNITGKPPTAPVVNSYGEPSKEFTSALKKKGLTFEDVIGATVKDSELDSTQLARKSFLEENGLTPTRAQVTGDATDFQSQQELMKRTGSVRSALEGQDQDLVRKFENAITSTGGTANPSNSPVFDFIGDKSIDLDKAITDAYKSARSVADGGKVVKAESLLPKLKSMAGTDAASNGVASAVRSFMKDKGIVTGKKLKADARFDVSTAEGLRQDINSLYNSASDFGKQQLRSLKESLDDDVARDVGQDIFGEARSAKAKFESDLNRVKNNKFDKRNANLLRDILENKISPETFLDDAVLRKSVRSTDIEQVKRYLLLDENPAGIAAWNDLRAEAMQRIASVAMPEVGGKGALSRSAMEKAMSRFGKDKLRVLFSPDERRFLDSMVKISKLREPVRMTQQGRGPSSQAVMLGAIANGMERIPLMADSFRGLAEKALNNGALEIPSPIRDKLLRTTQPAIAAAVTSGAIATQENK